MVSALLKLNVLELSQESPATQRSFVEQNIKNQDGEDLLTVRELKTIMSNHTSQHPL